MLQALAPVHAGNQPVLDIPAEDRFSAPDDEVMQHHSADHHHNHADVKLSYPTHGYAADVGRERGTYVHFRRYKFFRHAGMALSTCLNQVLPVDGRTRIAGR